MVKHVGPYVLKRYMIRYKQYCVEVWLHDSLVDLLEFTDSSVKEVETISVEWVLREEYHPRFNKGCK